MNVLYGLIFVIIGAVIILTVLPALLPTFYGGLNTTSAYSYCSSSNATHCLTSNALPLANLFSLNGILPLVLVAAVFIALIVGMIALIKGKR
jgi:hypothetical protein